MTLNGKVWIRFAAIVAAVALAAPAAADDFRVLGIDWAPFSFAAGAELRGIGVEIVDRLASATGNRIIARSEATWTRILDEANRPDVLIPLLKRTPDREDKFHWIGKMDDDRDCFVTKRSAAPVSTIDEARKLRSVGVNSGGAAEKTLRDAGLANVEAVPQNNLNVRKLALGRIDAWYTSALVATYTIKSEGLKPDDFVCSGNVKTSSYYVAASLGTPAPVVQAMKRAFKDLETKGVLKQIVRKYY